MERNAHPYLIRGQKWQVRFLYAGSVRKDVKIFRWYVPAAYPPHGRRNQMSRTGILQVRNSMLSILKFGTWSHRMSEWAILINPAQPLQTENGRWMVAEVYARASELSS